MAKLKNNIIAINSKSFQELVRSNSILKCAMICTEMIPIGSSIQKSTLMSRLLESFTISNPKPHHYQCSPEDKASKIRNNILI